LDNSLQKSFNFSFSLEEIAELLKIKFFAKKPKKIHLWTFQENLEFSAHGNSYTENSEILATFPAIVKIEFARKTDIWYYPNFTVYWELNKDQIKISKFYEGNGGKQGKEKLANFLTAGAEVRARTKEALEEKPFILECKEDDSLLRNKDQFVTEMRAHYPDLEFDLYKGNLVISGKGFSFEDRFRLTRKTRIKAVAVEKFKVKIKVARVLGNLVPDGYALNLTSPLERDGGVIFFGLRLALGEKYKIPMYLTVAQIRDAALFPHYVSEKIKEIKKSIQVLDEIENYFKIRVAPGEGYQTIEIVFVISGQEVLFNLSPEDFLPCLEDIRDRLKGGESVSGILQHYTQ